MSPEKPKKKPWRKTLTFSLSDDLLSRLKHHTEARSINTSKLMQKLVENHLKVESNNGH